MRHIADHLWMASSLPIFVCAIKCDCDSMPIHYNDRSANYNLVEFCHDEDVLCCCCCRIWKKSPKAEGIASIGLDQVISGSKTKFIRWKVHGDWVQQV